MKDCAPYLAADVSSSCSSLEGERFQAPYFCLVVGCQVVYLGLKMLCVLFLSVSHLLGMLHIFSYSTVIRSS